MANSEGKAYAMEDRHPQPVLSVATTVSSLDDAQRLALEILDQRLAACVQVEPGITSLYRWGGKLCEDSEVRVTIKTLPGQEAALRALFEQHHPYEVPQFLATRMEASPAYGEWVRGEVGDLPPT